ncbi:MAG: glycosyltransferase family 39 protein [candidate division Zixibacteria bacterium]|nr:glycosyltransferase family 39 protein [candidate division Zixibacteria bacterium]
MRDLLRRLIDKHPLAVLLAVGLLLRVIAAFFARGYMATDDHFQVIELAAQWLRGHHDYLPGDTQFYRSLLYPGVNWVLMALLHAMGVYNPDLVMLIDRLCHAVFSLWTIGLTYKLALLLSNRRAAWTSGLIVAMHAVMPYVAVRNLIEVVSMPFLLWGIYEITRAESEADWDRGTVVRWIGAGLALGLAFVIRWQVASGVAGIGLYLLFRHRWRAIGFVAGGVLIPVVLQGCWDWAWHDVFLGSLRAYLAQNVAHLYDTIVGPWHRYLLLIVGIFIPPFSLIFMAAMIRWVRRLGVLPWAAFAFLIAHSIIPSKQERFLLPIFPLLALMGTVGLEYWREFKGPVWHHWLRRGWIWFWIVNTPLLILALFNYSQKAKVEPLIKLYERGDASSVVLDLTESGGGMGMPEYYLDGADPSRPRPVIYEALKAEDLDSLRQKFASQAAPVPNYVLIYAKGGIEAHLVMLRERLGTVEPLEYIGPSVAERLLIFFNPRYHQAREVELCRLALHP